MVAYYPMLIEFCIEFKRYSREYLFKLKGKSVPTTHTYPTRW